MSKWKNYGLYTSIISAIVLIFPKYLPYNFEVIANSILGILVIAGIISNPSQGQGYIDEERFK